MSTVGFVGLGNMGSALAANLVGAGHTVVTTDAVGPERNVAGAEFVADAAAVAGRADIVVFSLPDGRVSEIVARQIVAAPERRCRYVVDTSTIGPSASRVIDGLLAAAGIGYVDAPVSGGVAGARARTLAVMYSGTDEACAAVGDVIAGLSDRTIRVGDHPGLAQVIKLANNFLSATALAATSEAIAFGVAAGVDMAVMLDVLSKSSGNNTATTDKFPNHVVTGKYASGFSNSLMAKDIALYLRSVEEIGTPTAYGHLTELVWRRFAEAQPSVDFTRIYPFVRGGE